MPNFLRGAAFALFLVPAAAFTLFLIPAAALAHHGWSSYDSSQAITHKAKLTDLLWGYPHGSAKTVFRKRKWDVILAPVARMEARGLTQAMLAPNRKVTLVGYPRRDGTAEMRIERVIVGKQTIELR